MLKFLKESIKEFEHVVWPTTNETKKYFYIVVGMITFLTVFLFIAGTIFSQILFVAKDNINPSSNVPTTQDTNSTNNLDLSNLNLGSGALDSTGSSNTGAIKGNEIEILPVATGSTKK